MRTDSASTRTMLDAATTTTDRAIVVPASEWLSDPDVLSGEWQGGTAGATISVIANVMAPGQGARLHHHPYAEVFVVRSGRVRFTVGDEHVVAGVGDIVVAPPDVPHGFVNVGPGPLEMLDIHEHPRFNTTWDA